MKGISKKLWLPELSKVVSIGGKKFSEIQNYSRKNIHLGLIDGLLIKGDSQGRVITEIQEALLNDCREKFYQVIHLDSMVSKNSHYGAIACLIKDKDYSDYLFRMTKSEVQKFNYEPLDAIPMGAEHLKTSALPIDGEAEALEKIESVCHFKLLDLDIIGVTNIDEIIGSYYNLEKTQKFRVLHWTAMTHPGEHIFEGVVEKGVLVLGGLGVVRLFVGYGSSGNPTLEVLNSMATNHLWDYVSGYQYQNWKHQSGNTNVDLRQPMLFDLESEYSEISGLHSSRALNQTLQEIDDLSDDYLRVAKLKILNNMILSGVLTRKIWRTLL